MARNFAQSSAQYLASIDAEIEHFQNLREQVAAAVDSNEAITKPAKPVRVSAHKQSFLCSGAAVLLGAFLQATATAQNPKPCSERLALKGSLVLPIDIINGFVFLRATVGGVAGRVKFDTGTPGTLNLNDHFLQSWGLVSKQDRRT